MRPILIPRVAVIVVIGLIATAFVAPRSEVAARDGSIFAGPAYPSAECTSVGRGVNLGVVPQQWNFGVGLPLASTGASPVQRIVIPEFDQVPSMVAVDALLRQCGLRAPDAPPLTLTGTSTLPAEWGAAVPALGGEATLDASVVYAALPPNTEVVIANAPGASAWYGFFVNAAQACGIDFATPPAPTDSAAAVPAMAKGANFPAGGCIITASYGGNEMVDFSGANAANSQAAAVVLSRLAELGVLTFVSAGDEGAGGCWQGSNGQLISAIALSTPDVTRDIDGITFFTGTATVTTPVAHGLTVGTDIALNSLSGPAGVEALVGIYDVVTTPTATTFTIEQGLATRLEFAPSAAVGIVSRLTPLNFGVTFNTEFARAPGINFLRQTGAKIAQFPATHPDVVAVGGTQWLPQQETLAWGNEIIYAPGRDYADFVWKSGNQNPNCSNAPNSKVFGQEGTGGGQSGIFDMPGYQQAQAQATYGNLGANPGRMMPDIAALAGWPTYGIGVPDPQNTGAPVLADFCPGAAFPCRASDFQWTQLVGTSAATPLVAVGFAQLNAVLASRGIAPVTKGGSNDVHTLIYNPANAAAIRDVPERRGTAPSGDNNLFGEIDGVTMGYPARNGFDMTTGMGVPNFTTLANLLIARNTPAPPPAPAPSPEPVPTPQPASPAPAPAPAPATPPAPDPVEQLLANPGAVTAAVLASFTPAQIASIPAQIFGQLPAAAFRGLAPDQVRALSPAQVAAIRPARARAIRPMVVRAFTPAQVRQLRPASVRALRPAQVRQLRPVQLRALRPVQVRQLRPAQRQVMTPAQLRAIRP